MIHEGSSELIIDIFKAIQETISGFRAVFFNNAASSFVLFEEVLDWIGSERQDSHSIAKPVHLKLSAVLIDSLKEIYSSDNVDDFPILLSRNCVDTLLALLRKIITCSKTSEGFPGMTAAGKLLGEEKLAFEFIERVAPTLRQREETFEAYLQYLLDFLDYRPSETRMEVFVRRSLSIVNNLILRGDFDAATLKAFLPRLYEKIGALINLRYDSEACMSIGFQLKSTNNLFYTSGLYALNISSFLINPESFKQRMESYFESTQSKKSDTQKRIPAYNPFLSAEASGSTGGPGGHLRRAGEELLGGADIMFSSSAGLEFNLSDPSQIASAEVIRESVSGEVQELVWKIVMEFLEETLVTRGEKVDEINKQIQADIMKCSQELDMQVMNFIINSMLPNCSEVSKHLQHKLIAIIDSGCNSYHVNYAGHGASFAGGGGSSAPSAGNSLSRYCISNLFELCRYS